MSALKTVNIGQRVFWHDPDEGTCSGYGTVTHIGKAFETDEIDEETIIALNKDDGGEAEVLIGELADYERSTPDDHLFVSVPKQTGCARCGYARGHHPTAAMLRQWQLDNDIEAT